MATTLQYISLQRVGGNRMSDRSSLLSCTGTPTGGYEILLSKRVKDRDVRGETEKGQRGANYVVVTNCQDVLDDAGVWKATRIRCEVRISGA